MIIDHRFARDAVVGAVAGSGADAGAAARGAGLRRAVARFPRGAGGGDRLRRVRLVALRLWRIGFRVAAAADALHARRGAGGAAARARCGGCAACGVGRPFRRRVDRRDPCRHGARSAGARRGDDRGRTSSSRTSTSPAFAASRRPTSRATCARGWRAITATWMWRSAAGTTPGSIRGSARSTSRSRSRASGCRCWRCRERTTRMAPTEQLRMLERTATCPVETRADRRRPPCAAPRSEGRPRWTRSCRSCGACLMAVAA